MGWSCRADASNTLDRMTKACIERTGTSNTYTVGLKCYFFEVSRTEHHDGAITGRIFKMLPGNLAKPSGSFRIEGDGTVSRAPKFLKDAAQNPVLDSEAERMIRMCQDGEITREELAQEVGHPLEPILPVT